MMCICICSLCCRYFREKSTFFCEYELRYSWQCLSAPQRFGADYQFYMTDLLLWGSPSLFASLYECVTVVNSIRQQPNMFGFFCWVFFGRSLFVLLHSIGGWIYQGFLKGWPANFTAILTAGNDRGFVWLWTVCKRWRCEQRSCGQPVACESLIVVCRDKNFLLEEQRIVKKNLHFVSMS